MSEPKSWSPWSSRTDDTFYSAHRAMLIRQQIAAHDLLATTLPRDFRFALRGFEESIARQLKGENDDAKTEALS